jgi:hypothetical protein
MTRTVLFALVALTATLVAAGCTVALGADTRTETLPEATVEVVHAEVEINDGAPVVIGLADEMEAVEFVAEAR